MRLTTAEIEKLLGERPTHRNTVQHDEVTFLRTSAETGGEYTLAHVVAEPGAGVARHYHLASAEHFEILEGVLTVQVAKRTQVLQTGESATVERTAVHRWVNQSSGTVRCLVEITPGAEGFEKGLQILYGLASDGRCWPNGVPRDPLLTAWLMEISDIRLPGLSRPFGPVLRAMAGRVRAQGIDRQLEERYCR